MARGTSYDTFGTDYNNAAPTGELCTDQFPDEPIAALILRKFGILSLSVFGDSLPGYDIKSQDALTIMRLSLLAEDKDDTELALKEVYIDARGKAVAVKVGKDPVALGKAECVAKTAINEFVNKVDHVVVRAKDPLPFRVHGEAVRVDFTKVYSPMTGCVDTEFTKELALQNEAWAELLYSLQSKTFQDKLKQAVDPAKWEQLIGYKMKFNNIPSHVSISESQTSPRFLEIPFAGIETRLTIPLGTDNSLTGEDDGHITDISNVNMLGAPILDIVRGTDIASLIQESSTQSSDGYPLGYNDYYVLLDHTCTVNSMSRGTNWYLQQGTADSATVIIRRNSGSAISFEALDFLEIPSGRTYVFRRTPVDGVGLISSFSDFVNNNVKPPTDESGSPAYTPRPPFSPEGGAVETVGSTLSLYPGIGGNFGYELKGLYLCYSVQRGSIYFRSYYGDAVGVAAGFVNTGLDYVPLKLIDEPAGAGWNGELVMPVPPSRDETDQICQETPLELLEGNIIDISAPFLNNDEVAKFSAKLKLFIDQDSGIFESASYIRGGYTILPGQAHPDNDKLVVHNVDISYADKDSVLVNVTYGPKYYTTQSFNDSQYVRRTDTITRTGRVITGDNRKGEFAVEVDGLGVYNAINGMLKPIYPGDRVEVKILNYPVEP